MSIYIETPIALPFLTLRPRVARRLRCAHAQTRTGRPTQQNLTALGEHFLDLQRMMGGRHLGVATSVSSICRLFTVTGTVQFLPRVAQLHFSDGAVRAGGPAHAADASSLRRRVRARSTRCRMSTAAFEFAWVLPRILKYDSHAELETIPRAGCWCVCKRLSKSSGRIARIPPAPKRARM